MGLKSKINSDYLSAANRLKKLDYKLVRVYVEGYDDIPFWRDVLDEFETRDLKFEINVPVRNDLAKGKKVVLSMAHQCGKELILCVDSDFDYIFGNYTEQSKTVNCEPYIFHTYAYSIENLICYSEGLHAVCVKATKNDVGVFDFVKFMEGYSRSIYSIFLWYALSARTKNEKFFTLLEFKNFARLNYVDIKDDGASTIEWSERQVNRKIERLEAEFPHMVDEVARFGVELQQKFNVQPENCYLFIQGHTLMDNVVMVLLKSVCNYLKDMSLSTIAKSNRRGTSLRNELSNYTNSLRSIHDILMSHNGYRNCYLYEMLHNDIKKFVTNNYS